MFHVNPLQTEDSLETSSLIFSEKQWKIFMCVVCCSADTAGNGFEHFSISFILFSKWSTMEFLSESKVTPFYIIA